MESFSSLMKKTSQFVGFNFRFDFNNKVIGPITDIPENFVCFFLTGKGKEIRRLKANWGMKGRQWRLEVQRGHPRLEAVWSHLFLHRLCCLLSLSLWQGYLHLMHLGISLLQSRIWRESYFDFFFCFLIKPFHLGSYFMTLNFKNKNLRSFVGV